MEEKICPFRSRPHLMNTTWSQEIYCQKESCMAWGLTKQARNVDFEKQELEFDYGYGCKLIERS